MSNLDAILSYQEVDISLRKILDEIDRNDENKRLEQAKNEFNKAKQVVADSEKQAEAIVAFYNNALVYYNENSKKVEELEQKFDNAQTEQEKNELLEQLNILRNKFVDLEKKLNERKQKTEKVLEEYRDAQERGRKLRVIHTTSKTKLEDLKKDKEPQINQLQAKLGALRPTLDKELFEMYSALAQDKKYPAFVSVTGDEKNYCCGGCGLALSQKNKGELKDKNMCKCETCRRMIYKK